MTFFLFFLSSDIFATTWEAARPYTQQISGQKVVVKAFPYDPYSGNSEFGVTRVYFKNKLLYSIDRYYREKIVTSDDGQYLAVVHTTNSLGVTSYILLGNEQINFSRPAIEIFKNGVPFKILTLRDVIDTSKLANNGRFFNWGYHVDIAAFRDAEYGCKSCKEIYGWKTLKTGDTTEIEPEEWEECKRECDSVEIKKEELRISESSIYVQQNALFVLTNQNTVVKLDFATLYIQQIPFAKIIPDKKLFDPAGINRRYKQVTYPDKQGMPDLKDGRSFKDEVANLFNLTVCDFKNGKCSFNIYVYHLVINRKGKCTHFHGTVYDHRESDASSEIAVKEMTEKLQKWVTQQTFKTNLIPKQFDRFSFLCDIDLN